MATEDCYSNQDDSSIFFDQESWDILLRPTISHDPKSADLLAHLLFYLKESIASGSEGCNQAIEVLECGLNRVYLYTEAHKLALDWYALYLTGDLKTWDEPHQVIKAVLDKSRAGK